MDCWGYIIGWGFAVLDDIEKGTLNPDGQWRRIRAGLRMGLMGSTAGAFRGWKSVEFLSTYPYLFCDSVLYKPSSDTMNTLVQQTERKSIQGDILALHIMQTIIMLNQLFNMYDSGNEFVISSSFIGGLLGTYSGWIGLVVSRFIHKQSLVRERKRTLWFSLAFAGIVIVLLIDAAAHVGWAPMHTALGAVGIWGFAFLYSRLGSRKSSE